MNDIIFYLQFVHYSNEELLELKKLIKDNIQGSSSHLISNRDMSEEYGIENSIGRIIFISNSNVQISESLGLFDLLEPIISKFDQLNLFLVRINGLFFNVNAAKRYMSLQDQLNLHSNYYDVVSFSKFYSLNWVFLDMFHLKSHIVFGNIKLNSISLNKIYNTEYI